MSWCIAPIGQTVRCVPSRVAGTQEYPNVPPGTYSWCDFVKLAKIPDPTGACKGTAGSGSSGGPITGDPPGGSTPPTSGCGTPMSQGSASQQTVTGFTAAEHLSQPMVGKVEDLPTYASVEALDPPEATMQAIVKKDNRGNITVAHQGIGAGYVTVQPGNIQRWHLYGDGGLAGTNERRYWPQVVPATTLLLFNAAPRSDDDLRTPTTRLGFGKAYPTGVLPADGWYFELDTSTASLIAQPTTSEGGDDTSGDAVFSVPSSVKIQHNQRTNTVYTSGPQTLDRTHDVVVCDTTAVAITITLPASPSDGDQYTIINAEAHDVTVGRNGNNINNVAADLTILELEAKTLVYVDSYGWYTIGCC